MLDSNAQAFLRMLRVRGWTAQSWGLEDAKWKQFDELTLTVLRQLATAVLTLADGDVSAKLDALEEFRNGVWYRKRDWHTPNIQWNNGFDDRGIDGETFREILEAVADLLDKHPWIRVSGIGVDDLGDRPRAETYPGDDGDVLMFFDRAFLRNAGGREHRAYAEEVSDEFTAGIAEHRRIGSSK